MNDTVHHMLSTLFCDDLWPIEKLTSLSLGELQDSSEKLTLGMTLGSSEKLTLGRSLGSSEKLTMRSGLELPLAVCPLLYYRFKMLP